MLNVSENLLKLFKAPKCQMFSPPALPVEVQYISRTLATFKIQDLLSPKYRISVCWKLVHR